MACLWRANAELYGKGSAAFEWRKYENGILCITLFNIKSNLV